MKNSFLLQKDDKCGPCNCTLAFLPLHHRVDSELSAGLLLMSAADGSHSHRCQLTGGHCIDSSLAHLSVCLSFCLSYLPEMELCVLSLYWPLVSTPHRHHLAKLSLIL